MKLTNTLRVTLVTLLLVAASGCKRDSRVDATKPLQESFQAAEPELKHAIDDVNARLKAGDYVQASRALEPVVTSRPLTEPQRQAVGMALQQINQAIAADPSLDTKEMYELRNKMYRAYDSGKHH